MGWDVGSMGPEEREGVREMRGCGERKEGGAWDGEEGWDEVVTEAGGGGPNNGGGRVSALRVQVE